MHHLQTRFDEPLTVPWIITEIGQGKVTGSPGMLRLALPGAARDAYHDAQISDYDRKRRFHWKPPLRMIVEARGENLCAGTAGFGFWNHPFAPGESGFHLPRAAWFFFSAPPNNMQLAKGVPGTGWKAATIDAQRWQFLTLAPTTPIAVLLMRIPALYERLWPIGQRAIGVSEKLLDPTLLNESHVYTLEWLADSVIFKIDDSIIHTTPTAPRGAMGFVAWVDNQYAIVTAQGRFGFGLAALEHEQALVLNSITIESLV